MKLPPWLMGAAALFWGWQTGHLALGAALAACLESANLVKARLDLRAIDYERIADFCSVVFAVLVVVLFFNLGATRGVLGALQWLPLAVAPIALAQRFGSAQAVRVSALFYSVRRQLRRDPSTPDRAIDVSGPYAALLVLAAGTANMRGAGYYLGMLALFAWGLFSLRPRHARRYAFPTLFVAAAAAGYAGQAGLNRLQASFEGLFEDWFVQLPNDAERVQTRIGTIGRLKEHDTIAMRVYAPKSAAPQLLHAASFNEYRDGSWLAREPRLSASPTANARGSLEIVYRLQRGTNLLPLPPGTVQILGVPDLPAKVPGLGTVAIQAPGGWLRYDTRYGAGDGWYAPAGASDLSLPPREKPTLERLAAQLELDPRDPLASVARLRSYFLQFEYSTWRERPPKKGMTALEDFLLVSRAGHCEYFATATTLLLRAAGIPARYATGYAVMEYSDLEGAWLVRARHAHAWSRAYIGGHWTDVDLTPPSWPEAEAGLQPPWEAAEDFARWVAFRLGNADEATRSGWLIALAIALAAILAWRIARRRGLVRSEAAPGVAIERRGTDSEFYLVERALSQRYRARSQGEALRDWCAEMEARLAAEERTAFRNLVELHHRHRFDPRGLTPHERAALRQGSLKLSV